jgi:hypothetical protein
MAEDRRLYLAEPGWLAAIKSDSDPMNCHHAEGPEGYYHRIATGEIYFHRDTERLCLNCAVKKGVLTPQRPSLLNR